MSEENNEFTGAEEFKEPEISEKKEFRCKNCGQSLEYAPGTNSMVCPYCGTENEIEISEEIIEELDLETYLAQLENGEETKDGNTLEEVATIVCSACGATTTLDPNVVSSECPFCGTKLVVTAESSKKLIKPKSVLPFKVTSKEAREAYQKWVKSLWFAPPKLKQYARTCENFSGLYIPYWTYDAQTESNYTGLRGINYTETQTVTINGKTETRTVVKTRWTPVSGHVSLFFDDVLIPASKSLNRSRLDLLEPWDLENIVPYEEKFLSGFRTETYQIGLKDGYEDAKKIMEDGVRSEVRNDIGGDNQKITSLSISYSNTTFKHTLLPIWISAYRFDTKVYRFMINGRTGKVSGDRPYCWWKIALFILSIIAVCVGIYYLIQ
ncbi:MAG: hypothetical protein HUK15_09420 [Bacteroidales bacterium]|nr:hypothetical protein [Bacteroidales bacterium]